MAFQETMVPKPVRQPYRPTAGYFDDFVGKYRFGEDGRGGEVSVTRRGNRLYESWGTDEPAEILSGKFDMFLTPGFPVLERFVRDRRGARCRNCLHPWRQRGRGQARPVKALGPPSNIALQRTRALAFARVRSAPSRRSPLAAVRPTGRLHDLTC